MRTSRVFLVTLLLASSGFMMFACGSSKKPPPKEPAVTETITDAGAEPEVEAEAPKSLYERLGGREAIAQVVDTFMKNVAADTKINKRFAKLKGKRLEEFKEKVVNQICEATGGDCEYTGKSMADAHKGMKIKEDEWNAFVADLKAALDEHKIDESDQADLMALLGPMHDDIVAGKKQAMKAKLDAILKPEQARYLGDLEPPRDPLLSEMEQYARDRRQPISDPEVASFLSVVARASGAKRLLEVGTNIGYGAIVLSRAAGADSRLVTIENDVEMCGVARAFIERAGLAERIEVLHADALAALATLEGDIDLAYIDCVKEHYPAYLDLILPKLSARGIIVADNVLWKGLVAPDDGPPASEMGRVQALRTFNHAIVSDSRLRGVILPLGDGVAYAVRV